MSSLRTAAKTELEIAELVQRLLRERLANMNMVAMSVAANGPLRKGLTRAQAAELLWSMTSPELYLCSHEIAPGPMSTIQNG